MNSLNDDISGWIDLGILGILFLITAVIVTLFGQLQGQTDTAILGVAYGLLILTCFFASLASSADFGFLRFYGIASELFPLGRGTIGLFFGGIFMSFFFTILGPLLITAYMKPGSVDPALGWVFTRIIAVGVEEYFFRGALMPSIEAFLEIRGNESWFSAIGAIVIVTLIWVFLFHWLAFFTAPSQFAVYSVFGLILAIVTRATKNISFSLGAHFGVNLIVDAAAALRAVVGT